MSFETTRALDTPDHSDAENPNASGQAFARCIDRLQEIIEAETRILKAGGRIDYDSLNLRKTHAFLELLQLSKNAPPEKLACSAERIRTFHARLLENAEILEKRLRAVQGIAAIIVERIRAEESDGTYTVRRNRSPR